MESKLGCVQAYRNSSSSSSPFVSLWEREGRDQNDDNKDTVKLSIINFFNFIYNIFIQGPINYKSFMSWLDYLVKLVALVVLMVNYILFGVPFASYIFGMSVFIFMLSAGSITMFGVLLNIYSFWYMVLCFCATFLLVFIVQFPYYRAFLYRNRCF